MRKSRLGQNFLVNKGVIAKIIQAAHLTGAETVLEIGPGKGALTFALAKVAQKVIAIEKDKALAEALREKLVEQKIENVEVITDDILRFLVSRFTFHVSTGLTNFDADREESEACDEPYEEVRRGADTAFDKGMRKMRKSYSNYSVVANIPYYLTSALIRKLLELENKPHAIILTIQKEVAQRIVAKNGKESILSLSVKFYADAKILFYISRGSFFPIPNVDSACIEITPQAKNQTIPADAFFAVMKAGFSAPRKKLFGNLARKLAADKTKLANAFAQAKIDASARPETLSLDQWIDLTKNLK